MVIRWLFLTQPVIFLNAVHYLKQNRGIKHYCLFYKEELQILLFTEVWGKKYKIIYKINKNLIVFYNVTEVKK